MLLPQAGKHSRRSGAAAAAVLRSDYVVGTAVLCCYSTGAALMCYDWAGALERGTGCDVGAEGRLGVVHRRGLAGQREGGEECGSGHVSLYASKETLYSWVPKTQVSFPVRIPLLSFVAHWSGVWGGGVGCVGWWGRVCVLHWSGVWGGGVGCVGWWHSTP